MKVNVGNDEFCPKCMDWKEYDDKGRCKVCKTLIKKSRAVNKYEEYRIEESYEPEEDLSSVEE